MTTKADNNTLYWEVGHSDSDSDSGSDNGIGSGSGSESDSERATWVYTEEHEWLSKMDTAMDAHIMVNEHNKVVPLIRSAHTLLEANAAGRFRVMLTAAAGPRPFPYLDDLRDALGKITPPSILGK